MAASSFDLSIYPLTLKIRSMQLMTRLPLERKLSTKSTDEVAMIEQTLVADPSSGAARHLPRKGEG